MKKIEFMKYMCIIDDFVSLKPISYDWNGLNNSITIEYSEKANNKKDISSEIDFLQDEKDFVCREYTGNSITLNDGFLTIIVKSR